MKDEFIKIKFIMPEKTHSVSIERDKLLVLMTGIMNTFVDNNVISTKLVEVLPHVESIVINRVRNEELDVPFVSLFMEDGGYKTIRVNRNHKVIWSIFDEFGKE